MKEAATHTLKTWPEYYHAVATGHKTFEVRKDDRGFEVGDTLILRDYDPDYDSYSGCEITARITYKLAPGVGCQVGGIMPGYCVLGIEILKEV